MASFAFGLTKTAVEATVSTAKSAIEEEKKLRDDVQHDLELITAEFQMMQAFLNNVSNRDQSEVLRELALDVEDWVEFAAHLDVHRSAWLWRMLPQCLLKRTQDLDLAAAQIKLLKARLENISQRSMHYNLVTAGGSGSGSISRPAEQIVAGAGVVSPLDFGFGILRQVWEAAGKLCAMLNLQRIITTEGGHDRQVISVWGSRGGDHLGTTSVIREAYCDAHIRQEFSARAWVKLADPFNLHDFLDSLMAQLRKSRRCFQLPVQWEDDDDDDGLLKEKYLVVLENVSTVVQWDDIKMHLPDYKNGSRIVVSTHDIGLAFMCTGKPYLVSELTRFPDGHSLCAFFRKAPPESPIDLEKFIKEITCPTVISVWGSSRAKSIFVDRVYRSSRLEFIFETYGWVHVPDYWFDLKLISRQLYLDLCSFGGSVYNDETKHANETVNAIEEAALIQRCCKFLREKACLVVIDGLSSRQGWDLFKDTYLSEPIRGCIIVITNEEKMARHCADRGRALHIKDDLEVGSASEIFSIRKEKARNWTKTAQIVESHQRLALNFSILLLQDPGVVSVWGVPGVGKSYLVRTSYYHHMLRSWGQLFTVNSHPIWLDIRNEENPEDEFTAFSWVHVPHPFSLMTFSHSLLRDFYSDDLQAMETAAVGIMQGQDLYEECRKILSQNKYFLVIDGLQSTHEWDMIKQAFFPRRVDGCVVVIAHEAKMARHCQADEERRLNVQAFQADEAHNLFMKVVWKNKQLSPDEMELSIGILSRCGRLPKIISAIEEYCRPSTYLLELVNDDFMGNLESNDPAFHRLRGLFSWMKYHFGSDKLKPCIFYMSVFPVNHIRWRRLLSRWIAEGYCRDKAFTTVDAEGEMLLSELINLSILQVQHTPRKILELNGFFREYLITRPMEGDLVFELKGNCTVNSQRTGQHLTIRSNWDRDKIVFENINFSRLRSLTVSGEWRSFFISANNNMRLLRVLDLENSSGVTDDDLEQIVKLLHRLKFLSLRGCREITRLPDSLGGLRQLHTLDIRYTSILVLPLVIIKLEKLQYINAGTTESWDLTSPMEAATIEDQASTSLEEDGDSTIKSLQPLWNSRARQLVSSCCLAKKIYTCRQARAHNGSIKVPARIGKLTALQTLGVVNVSGAGGKAVSKELKKLTQLRKLRVSGISKENYQELFSSISAHAHLESLSVRLEKDQDDGFCYLDDIPEPPRNLKSFKLYGHVHRLPTWMKHLDRLSKVDLEMTISEQEDTRFYERLPIQPIQGRISVKAVEIVQLHFRAPEDSGTYPYWTKSFRVFKIDCTSRLQVTFTNDYITRFVELLVVNFSSGSSLSISGLEHLDWLKEVWLKGSYDLKLWQQFKQQLSEHPMKPVLKPKQPSFA